MKDGKTKIEWGRGKPRKRTSAANWKQVETWNREAIGAPTRPRVFCASLADWLDDEVPLEWLADLLDLIRRTPNLDWLLLTKRPENFWPRLLEIKDTDLIYANTEGFPEWLRQWYQEKMPPENVWIGTSVEDQVRAKERIPHLLSIPARIRFLSVEPMLGPVGLVGLINGVMIQNGQYARQTRLLNNSPVDPNIHWVICGGESGGNARPFDVEWARDLRTQCEAAGVAFFMKQLGALSYDGSTEDPEHPPTWFKLKDKKGGDMAEWPEDLRIRQFPNP